MRRIQGFSRKFTASYLAYMLAAPFWVIVSEVAVAAPGDEALTYRHIEVEDGDGRVSSVTPIPAPALPKWAADVRQEPWDWQANAPDAREPYFAGPIPFVLPPEAGSGEPFHPHNHQPSIAWLPNGDLFAIWYSTVKEQGPELTVLASRLRAGATAWDPSSEFFKAPERNMHGSSIFNRGDGTLVHINGMGHAGVSRKENKHLALLCRLSDSNGQTWTAPMLASPAYNETQQPISGGFRLSDGTLVQPCDATKPKASNYSAIQVSRDGGRTWDNPAGAAAGAFSDDDAAEGPLIAGIHAGIVELKDGRLMALARRHDIDGRMPASYSSDGGKTWRYEASSFPPIGGGQRLVLMRLQEGPILLVSFTDKRNAEDKQGLRFTDTNGNEFTGYGLFAALSFDEGKTWPTKTLVTPGSGDYDGGAWTGPFSASPTNAEHGGYLAGTQSPDGVIHLISSRLHYRFNLAWLKALNAGPKS